MPLALLGFSIFSCLESPFPCVALWAPSLLFRLNYTGVISSERNFYQIIALDYFIFYSGFQTTLWNQFFDGLLNASASSYSLLASLQAKHMLFLPCSFILFLKPSHKHFVYQPKATMEASLTEPTRSSALKVLRMIFVPLSP